MDRERQRFLDEDIFACCQRGFGQLAVSNGGRGNRDRADFRVCKAVQYPGAALHVRTGLEPVEPGRVSVADRAEDAEAVERADEVLAPVAGAEDGEVSSS